MAFVAQNVVLIACLVARSQLSICLHKCKESPFSFSTYSPGLNQAASYKCMV